MAATTTVRRSWSTPRYVRVLATRLGADDFGNHYLRLAEIVPTIGP